MRLARPNLRQIWRYLAARWRLGKARYFCPTTVWCEPVELLRTCVKGLELRTLNIDHPTSNELHGTAVCVRCSVLNVRFSVAPHSIAGQPLDGSEEREDTDMTNHKGTATEVQAEVQRSLGGTGRLLVAIEMSIALRELSLTRLRHEHPEWSESQCRRELLRYAFLPEPLPEPLR